MTLSELRYLPNDEWDERLSATVTASPFF